MSDSRKKKHTLSIREALDALSYLAEFEEITDENVLSLGSLEGVTPITGDIKEITELKGLTENKIREIFSVILGYLKKIQERDEETEGEGIGSVKSIMMMVGDAAKNLDRFTRIFKSKSGKSVTQYAEYKRLQEFYTRKIEQQVDEGLLSRWIVGLAGGETERIHRKARARKKEKSQHVFVDLEMVKRDTEYELLLMRKEDGTRFFSPRLIRNIKLVCDFGGYSGEGPDIFSKVHDWRDVICHVASINMLRNLNLSMRRFYHEAFRYKGQEVVGSLNKAFMALMLCANPQNLRVNLESQSGKTCLDYFGDFQQYLRLGLTTREYQKLIAYPPKRENVMGNCILAVTQRTCRAMYLHLHVMQELFFQVHKLLGEARTFLPKTTHTDDEKGIFSWSKLAYDYSEIIKSLKKHADGPLQRILESLEEARYTSFDSLLQFNLPHTWFDLYVDDVRVTHLRMASPTRQTMINKAVVNDEFKSFLKSVARDGTPTHHLLINLQDRTSWREVSRCQVVEQLQKGEPFIENLTVVTFAVDTPFYQQTDEFESLDKVKDFIQEFKKQLKSTSGGFYFTDTISNEIFPGFVKDTLDKIHKFFFNSQKYLSKKDRKNFITIFYNFLTLKLIDLVNPTSFSLSCKDAIDSGGTASVFLYVFLKLMKESELNEYETEFIEAMIYGPAILIRERALLPETLNRVLRALQAVEGLKERLGFEGFRDGVMKTFGPLYDTPVLESSIRVPVQEVERGVEEEAA